MRDVAATKSRLSKPMTEQHQRLGDILLREGKITADQLQRALEKQKADRRRLGEILISQGIISDADLTAVLAKAFHLPLVRLAEYAIDEKAAGIFSREILKKHQVFPIALDDQRLTIATNNPLDLSSLQELQYISGYQINPVMANLYDIEEHIDKYAEFLRTMQAIKDATDEKTEEGQIMNLANSILARAVKERVSDIHMQPLSEKMRVRFRIDGVLYDKIFVPKELERKLVSRIKIMSDMDVAESRRPQDGRISLEDSGQQFDVRVSTLPDVLGENVVMRILRRAVTNFSFQSLGMDKQEVQFINKIISRPHGIILVTGPTGSGKTTSLYAMLNRLNDSTRSIITVEDPVEYKIEGINQTAINVKAGYTFAAAMRNILRHDPDIIMVGEIRDVETAEIAIRAALTGHLVLSTLHTNNAAGAVTRLLDMDLEPFLVSSTVIGVVAQRLVRRLCPECSRSYDPDPEVCAYIRRILPDAPETFKLAAPVGCRKCFNTGYSGRIAIYENFYVYPEIQKLILKSPTEADITALARSKRMKSLRAAGLIKAVTRVTSLEEVLRITFAEEAHHAHVHL